MAAARDALASGPRTLGELADAGAAVEPDREDAARRYIVRTHLPLVQVAEGGKWGFGNAPPYVLAETDDDGDIGDLVRRYLAAFGPASVKDVQAWAGFAGLRGPIGELRDELVTYRDPDGVELLDLPGAPLPDAAIPAPVRLIPEYDNLVLGHANRRRIIADEHKPAVFIGAGRVRATILVDGFVAGTWRIERAGARATLRIEPFRKLSAAHREKLAGEGERLLAWAEPDASANVEFT